MEDNFKILKVEYLSNHWPDLSQTLNLSIGDRELFLLPPSGLVKKEDFNDKKMAYFGRTKAKMGRFCEKGLFYSFEMLHGLLSNKNWA